ncbi:hypothetical protein J6590_039038 [Homalodisca vitripennis]|nr:hypothetical protein J6590_039038 [Homalodisca vitripennis]
MSPTAQILPTEHEERPELPDLDFSHSLSLVSVISQLLIGPLAVLSRTISQDIEHLHVIGVGQSADHNLKARCPIFLKMSLISVVPGDVDTTSAGGRICSAYAYENEEAIGQAIREWMDIGGLKREDFFITTKLPNIAMRQELVDEYLQRSLKNLQLDYVELYLIQNTVVYKPGYELYPHDKDGSIELDFQSDHDKIWQAMEKKVDKGCAKHIGLSNFSLRQVDRLMEKASIPPAKHTGGMPPLLSTTGDNSVVFTAYACLGSPAMMNFFREARKNSEIKMKSPLDDPLVDRLSRVHKKTKAQILLRHLLQLGVVVIPKSSTTEHMLENINVFDFELSTQELAELNALDQGEHGRKFSLVGFFKGYEKHPENPHPLDD